MVSNKIKRGFYFVPLLFVCIFLFCISQKISKHIYLYTTQVLLKISNDMVLFELNITSIPSVLD